MIQEKIETFEKVVMRDYGNIAGIVVLKNGGTLYENYFNGCTINSRIHVYSVTKSIISILIGIAMDKGYIKNLDQKVLHFFPEYKIKKREACSMRASVSILAGLPLFGKRIFCRKSPVISL